jgi:hypothetical protein
MEHLPLEVEAKTAMLSVERNGVTREAEMVNGVVVFDPAVTLKVLMMPASDSVICTVPAGPDEDPAVMPEEQERENEREKTRDVWIRKK